MSRRNKLEKFAEIGRLPNVFQNFSSVQPQLINNRREIVSMKGRWAVHHFGNNNFIILELACGKGEYTLAMSQIEPVKNYIGVDIKGARIWKGAKKADQEALSNVAFIRSRIEFLPYFLDRGEVDEIWITFPDPHPRSSKSGKRLTSARFLNSYRNYLKDGGRIHLKTDSRLLYDYTLDVLRLNNIQAEVTLDSIYDSNPTNPLLLVKTFYENQHLNAGLSIKYVCFKLPVYQEILSPA